MNGIYLVPYSLSGDSGKNRATRQKAVALTHEVDNLKVFFPSASSLLVRSLQIVGNEIRVSWLICTHRNSLDFLITRGAAGLISVPTAKLFRVRTLREVHSIPDQQAQYLKGRKPKKLLAQMVGVLDLLISRHSDVRIFNHPKLYEFFKEKRWIKNRDFFCYNGGAPEAAVDISKKKARIELGLPIDYEILVFVGSASNWHGIDYLVALNSEMEQRRPSMIIVCGGGDITDYDPERRLWNITPLDSRGSSKLIRAADACLLPVRDVRVSPGSPLKLYDYALNGRPVIAQKGVLGYEDEVETLGIGFAVDFSSPGKAADKICRFMDSRFEMPTRQALSDAVSWRSRIKVWLNKGLGV